MAQQAPYGFAEFEAVVLKRYDDCECVSLLVSRLLFAAGPVGSGVSLGRSSLESKGNAWACCSGR